MRIRIRSNRDWDQNWTAPSAPCGPRPAAKARPGVSVGGGLLVSGENALPVACRILDPSAISWGLLGGAAPCWGAVFCTLLGRTPGPEQGLPAIAYESDEPHLESRRNPTRPPAPPETVSAIAVASRAFADTEQLAAGTIAGFGSGEP